VATVLFLWHGGLASLPHNHADSSVHRQIVGCTASNDSSPIDHWHASGRSLSSSLCLACLAGSTVTHAPKVENVASAAISGPSMTVAPLRLRPLLHTHLPLLRGPPATT